MANSIKGGFAGDGQKLHNLVGADAFFDRVINLDLSAHPRVDAGVLGECSQARRQAATRGTRRMQAVEVVAELLDGAVELSSNQCQRSTKLLEVRVGCPLRRRQTEHCSVQNLHTIIM